MHAALQAAGQGERAPAARRRAARVPGRLARRGEPARERGDGRLPRSPPRARGRAERCRGRPLPRDPRPLRARASASCPGGIYGHQSPRMLVPDAYPVLLRARRGRAPLGRRRQRVPRPDVLVRPDRPRPQPSARSTRRHAGRRRRGAASTARARVWVELAERLVSLTPVGGVGGLREERLRRLHLGDAGRARRHGQARRCWRPRARTTARIAWCSPMPGGMTPEDRAHVARFRWNDLAERRRARWTRTTATWPAIMVAPVPARRLPRPGDGRARASCRACAHAATASARC